MDERYQSNLRSDVGIMQPSNDSAYSAFGKSAEPIQSGRNSNIEFDSTKKSVYGQDQRLQRGYMSDLEGQSHRSKEFSSYRYREPERNSASKYDMEFQPDPLIKQGRRRHRRRERRYSHRSKHEQRKHSYDKRICDKFWKNLCFFFKTKEKHHRKHRKHRKHRERVWDKAMTNEGYPAMPEAISASSMSSVFAPQEAKALQTIPPQSTVPENPNSLGARDQREKTSEEKIEEKEKLNGKVTKSTSVEQMQQKVPESISKTKPIEELPPVKCEQIDEVDQQMQQKRKVIQFIEQIAKFGVEGMKDEFIHCRTFIPTGVTRTAHDQNLKRCRYPDVICIDQTRVVLKSGDGCSDFIHASRIPLGDNPNEIIITQLPLSNTVKHFWEMVWQENVRTILLFLTLNEWKQHAENIQLIPGKGKCLHFEEFMSLTHKNEVNITPDWLVREYYLSKNDETRRILWYHYSAWEPNRSPKDCEHLWPLHSSLRKMRRPYVCMSLAGAGRAGCYAALEWAHLMLHDKNSSTINIVECVRKVRMYRMHAVQTIAQFQFLYMGIQRHIFLVEKFRKEILSEQAVFEATKKCSSIEDNYFRSGGYPTNDDFDL